MQKKILLLFLMLSKNNCTLEDLKKRNKTIDDSYRLIVTIVKNSKTFIDLAEICSIPKKQSMAHHIYYSLFNFKRMIECRYNTKTFYYYYRHFTFHKKQIPDMFDRIYDQLNKVYLTPDGKKSLDQEIKFHNIESYEFVKLLNHINQDEVFLNGYLNYYEEKIDFTKSIPLIAFDESDNIDDRVTKVLEHFKNIRI